MRSHSEQQPSEAIFSMKGSGTFRIRFSNGLAQTTQISGLRRSNTDTGGTLLAKSQPENAAILEHCEDAMMQRLGTPSQ